MTTEHEATTGPVENARFPLEPLLVKLSIRHGRWGGQQPGQPLEGLSELAALLEVTQRTAQRMCERGLRAYEADRAAVAARCLPHEIWSEWWADIDGDGDWYSDDPPFFTEETPTVTAGVTLTVNGLMLVDERIAA